MLRGKTPAEAVTKDADKKVGWVSPTAALPGHSEPDKGAESLYY